jgi:hypothetical protein
MKDIMITELKSVNNVLQNVEPVINKVVMNVPMVELTLQFVTAQLDNTLMLTINVNHVHTDVKSVLVTQITVQNVPKTELINQIVLVLPVPSMMEATQFVLPVLKDVPLVLLATHALLVPQEELMLHTVLVHPELLNNVPLLEPIYVIPLVILQPVFLVILNV